MTKEVSSCCGKRVRINLVSGGWFCECGKDCEPVKPKRKRSTLSKVRKERMKAGTPQVAKLLKRALGTGKKSDRTKWKEAADKWFSEWIRLRDAGPDGRVKCVTCSHTDHWRYLQCGHYVTRGHQSVRFDEQNANCQCRGCNYNGGQHLKHAVAIDAKYGEGTAKKLEAKGAQRCNRTTSDYRFIAETYRKRAEWIREHEPERYTSPGKVA